MSFNKFHKSSGQIDLTDRLAIETGLCRGESFKKIAKTIHACLIRFIKNGPHPAR